MNTDLETRSRALFDDSVAALDMPTRSRLAQARHAALAAATAHRPARFWWWTPAVGLCAALVLAVTLWSPSAWHHRGGAPEAQPNLEDLEILAASDDGGGDNLEMLQDDLEFYDWADKAALAEPAA